MAFFCFSVNISMSNGIIFLRFCNACSLLVKMNEKCLTSSIIIETADDDIDVASNYGVMRMLNVVRMMGAKANDE